MASHFLFFDIKHTTDPTPAAPTPAAAVDTPAVTVDTTPAANDAVAVDTAHAATGPTVHATPVVGAEGFVCSSCKAYNAIPVPDDNDNDTWYTVSAGLRVGVFSDWVSILPLPPELTLC